MNSPHVRLGIIGAGFVGQAFVKMVHDQTRHVALVDAANATLEVVGVAVRDTTVSRDGIDPSLLVSDPLALAAREDVDILVEVAGGIEPARTWIETALRRGASVVTANKALMAACGTELAKLADENGADLLYEASVGGGIPIIRALRTSLAGEKINRVIGIVNGTTNFILSQMTSEGRDYEDALKEAQLLGYAEVDPAADVEAFDSAAKVQILSSLAIGTGLYGEPISREGITAVRSVDVEFARRAGYVIKLIGVVERVGENGISRRTHPALVPVDHPLAAVHGAMNAVFIEGDKSGPLMWLGQGAGGDATASAVLGDVLHASRNRVSGRHDLPFTVDDRLESVDAGEISSVFYLSLDVRDEPGVLAQVAGVFGRHNVSIQSMEQSGFGQEARLAFLTHEAMARDVLSTLDDLRQLTSVDSIGACIRVIDGGSA
jgi:homoserine dehydrogenase